MKSFRRNNSISDLSRVVDPADSKSVATHIRYRSADQKKEDDAESRAKLEVQLQQYIMEDQVLDRQIQMA